MSRILSRYEVFEGIEPGVSRCLCFSRLSEIRARGGGFFVNKNIVRITLKCYKIIL